MSRGIRILFTLGCVAEVGRSSLAGSVAYASDAPKMCGGLRPSPSASINDLRRRLQEKHGDTLGTHDRTELGILERIFAGQAKETLCEMVLIEAISPYGWFGETSRTETPASMERLSASFGQDKFLRETRSKLSPQREVIRAKFQTTVEGGLADVAQKMREVQSQVANARTSEKASELRQEVEVVFRDSLPYANHPILRDYYNRVLSVAFSAGAAHPTAAEIPRRVKAAMGTTKAYLEEALAEMRASLEVEASVYSDMQNDSRRGGSGGYWNEGYKRTLGLLGGFSGAGATAQESGALTRLEGLYGDQKKTLDLSNAKVVADLGMVFAPPVIGDAYSIGAELNEFDQQIRGCNPTTPKGLREGSCETLRSAESGSGLEWSADFYGGAPDGSGCQWKTAAQAGAVVLSAIPIVNRGLRVLRARRAPQLVHQLSKATEPGAVKRAAGSSIGDPTALSKAVVRGERHVIERAERNRQGAYQLGQEMHRVKMELSSLAGRKKDLEFDLKRVVRNKGPAPTGGQDLNELNGKIEDLTKRLMLLEKRGERTLVEHSRSVLRRADSNPAVGKNAHLDEHFLPEECFLSDCSKHLAKVAQIRRKKSITFFFPKGIKTKDLLNPETLNIIRERPAVRAMTTMNYAETVHSGQKLRYAIVVCHNPKGCGNSAFGEIETIYPVCGKGTKVLVAQRLVDGQICD